MSGRITTHILDLASGKPAAGVTVRLLRGDVVLATVVTNADGRTNAPLLSGDLLVAGEYRIEFAVGDYFAAQKNPDARKFLDVVPVDFVVTEPNRNYHVPLLVSPWSYSTYRGS